MNSWHSYPKIYSVGHSYLTEFFNEPVIIEEKVDGSQFSFGIFNGELKIRSKGVEMIFQAPEKMFLRAAETVAMLSPLLQEGWTYRAEYLNKKQHNCVAYDRTPKNHLILFDINTGLECYLTYEDKAKEAERLGLEVVPLLYHGIVSSSEQFMSFLQTTSILGGQKVEGVVCKNYSKMGPDKKSLMAKFVSEEFKELNKVTWKAANPKQNDILELLSDRYPSQTRWLKGIQHLKDKGLLTMAPQDIPVLMKEVQSDFEIECLDDMKVFLLKWALPHISRKIVKGLPEFYKEWLVKQQFNSSCEIGK